ncbi:Argininosuccinate lyase 2, partial [Globisporangium splendens]
MGNNAGKPLDDAQQQAQAPPSPQRAAKNEPEFRVLSSDQRAVTFDERVHLRSTSGEFDRITISTTQPMSGFRPLQRAATYDPRLRTQKKLLTASDVMYRRYFNAVEDRDSTGDATRNLYRIAEEDVDTRKEAVVVLDPFSTGMTLAESVMKRGYACICVYSDTLLVMKDLIKHIPQSFTDKYAAIIFHNGAHDHAEQAYQDTVSAIKKVEGVKIIGIIAGAETGVMMADKLSEDFGLTTNYSRGSDARRNKYLMGEKVRAAGLRAVKQRSATKWSQIVDFIENELKPSPFRVIVKPNESAGSDDVFLCTSMDEVKRAFGNIQGKINSLGLENSATLVQEFLDGTEYVVDTVSRNGVHKVVAVWEYDKRVMNGAPFVYFGVLLRAAAGDVLTPVVNYVLKVLDALEIVHGPGHAEVKFVNGEPCLVEIGSRCHGGEGTYVPIVNHCIGYNQVECALDSYFDEDAFNALPERPTTLKAYGCEAMLVSYQRGVLEGYPGMKEIEAMSSYVSQSLHVHENDELTITIDMFTTPGSVLMVNDDPEQLKRDYDRVRELERDGLYKLAESVPDVTFEEKKVVVVVDPFSTGAVVAHSLMHRGYECICVYSDKLENIENVASLIPEGLTLTFAATIAYEGSLDKTIAAVKKAAQAVLEQNRPVNAGLGNKTDKLIHAVFPGAELGVRLADSLSDSLGLDSNIIELSAARRDKYLMGETLRNSGVRAVKQVKASSWEEAEDFLENALKPSPFEVVLKPLESAGTEDVILCLSMEQAKKTFHSILGKINGLGIENNAVLLQEYLEGDEYVVDTTSRNGEHKVIAIWKYDKRRVNNAAFVYFGLSITPAVGVVNELIEYQFRVLDALGIRNGPAHGEVKFCRGSPVLIEVGSRCHGGEGAWVPIANKCVGYNQVGAAIDSYLDPDAFDKLPERPTTLLEYGCEAMLVSYKNGVVKSIPGLAEIEKFPSFLKKEIFVGPGDMVRQTIDMFTTPGSIMLTHESKDVLEANLARIRELEVDGLFELQ